MNRRSIIWLVNGAVVAIATVVSIAVAGAGAAQDDGEPVTQRSGERMRAYLGTNITPDQWAFIVRQRGSGIPACEADFAAQDRSGTGYTDADQLAVADPQSFGDRYGYGVAQDALDRRAASSAHSGDSSGLPDPEMLGESTACVSQLEPRLADLFAPPEVWQRFGSLLQQASTSDRYRAGSEDWAKCMAVNGFAVTDPMRVEGYVHQVMVDREIELGLDPRIVEEAPDRVTTLSDAELAELGKFELALYDSDVRCKETSGLEKTMFDIESDMLRTLESEFEFAGVLYAE